MDKDNNGHHEAQESMSISMTSKASQSQVAESKRKSTLLMLPEEIRYQIFSYLAKPTNTYQFNWDCSEHKLQINWHMDFLYMVPPQIRYEAIRGYYANKQLIIDLPDFEPCSLYDANFTDHSAIRWPSEIHFHDQHDNFSFWIAPPFLSDSTLDLSISARGSIKELIKCPLYLFKEIEIRIPPPKTQDTTQLIMNWNRLRFLSHALVDAIDNTPETWHKLRYEAMPLPPVKVIFLEDISAGRSWFDKSGKLKKSVPVPKRLFIGDEIDNPSDLLVLLRALTPLRGTLQLTVEPSLPDHIKNARFSVAWITNPRIQRHIYGDYVDLQWSDYESFHWLKNCQLLFHHILLTLDTPVAPFLRLEQMASAIHFNRLNHDELAYEQFAVSEVCRESYELLQAIQCHAFVLSPWNGKGVCRCGSAYRCWIDRYNEHERSDYLEQTEVDEETCSGRRSPDDTGYYYSRWRDQFYKARSKLRIANGFAEDHLPISDLLGYRNIITYETTGSLKRKSTKHSTAKEFFQAKRSECTCFVPTKFDRYTRHIIRSPKAWIMSWPRGIVFDPETIQEHKEQHCCSNAQWV